MNTTADDTASIHAAELEVRLVASPAEKDAAQALRYRVFYEEMGAKPTPEMQAVRRDFDSMDEHCDHLVVIDHSLPCDKDTGKIVGTYRLIRRAAAEANGTFYSAMEYDITPLLKYPGEILELGRSCIAASHRSVTVMQTLWRGLAGYIVRHNITVMFGCASLHGTDVNEHAVALSYLYHHHLAPPALRAIALPDRYIDMRLLPRETFDPDQAFKDMKIGLRNGIAKLPPLIKGYLRVGGYVGEGAVIDWQFNTTDVFIIVKTDLIASSYMKHYERTNSADNDI